MRLLRVLLALALSAISTAAQQPANINTYIHQSWDSLSRSMTDCKSLVDTKLTTEPVLYLPAEEKIPPAVSALQHQCKVEVRHLPRSIHHEGELSPEQIRTPGLLYLPNKYVVPGGRFNEMYGWDSYFIILGLLADGRTDLARGMAENFFYEIEHYGSVLNANRTYYLTRSQPPFLSSIVLDIYRADLPKHPTEAKAFLNRALPYLIKDHALWTNAPHLAGTTGLSRYLDLGHGPVPEMADDSTYYVDVIHWLFAHPEQAPPGYLRKADPSKPPCTANCLRTSADGYELTESFFSGDRAMRESGFDPSFRFGPFSGSTEDYAPICLNALLYKYELDLAAIENALGNAPASPHWETLARTRQATINKLMWDDTVGLFFDYNTVTSQRSDYRYITTYYALWTGLASKQQAARLAASVANFEGPGGLAMSTRSTGLQWDAPFGWAPTNWLAIDGLHKYCYETDARRIAQNFSSTIERNFIHDGTIREKYNVQSADANVAISTGYKANIIGFGWTNGVYLQMQRLLAPAPQH